MTVIQCDFCQGKKLHLINEEADVYFKCMKCKGVGSVRMEGDYFFVMEELIDKELNEQFELDARAKLKEWAKIYYTEK
jgi:hypothetical protein